MIEINNEMRHRGWRPPTSDPELAELIRDHFEANSYFAEAIPGADRDGFVHHGTYGGSVGNDWPEAREMLRVAHMYGFRCLCLVHDGENGTDECSLDDFNSPPDIAQVYETQNLVELLWL